MIPQPTRFVHGQALRPETFNHILDTLRRMRPIAGTGVTLNFTANGVVISARGGGGNTVVVSGGGGGGSSKPEPWEVRDFGEEVVDGTPIRKFGLYLGSWDGVAWLDENTASAEGLGEGVQVGHFHALKDALVKTYEAFVHDGWGWLDISNVVDATNLADGEERHVELWFNRSGITPSQPPTLALRVRLSVSDEDKGLPTIRRKGDEVVAILARIKKTGQSLQVFCKTGDISESFVEGIMRLCEVQGGTGSGTTYVNAAGTTFDPNKTYALVTFGRRTIAPHGWGESMESEQAVWSVLPVTSHAGDHLEGVL